MQVASRSEPTAASPSFRSPANQASGYGPSQPRGTPSLPGGLNPMPRPLWILLGASLAVAAALSHRTVGRALMGPREGARIWAQDCVSCHGPLGEGVAGKSDEALRGEKTVAALADYVAREMPEDDPGSLSAEEARRVAEHLHGAFYSPEAQARLHPPRHELLRLTARQWQESLADIGVVVGHGRPFRAEPGGVRLRLAKIDAKGAHAPPSVDRVVAVLGADFGSGEPEPGFGDGPFSAKWMGSLLPTETGWHEFRVTSPNDLRLHVNAHVWDPVARAFAPSTAELLLGSGGVRVATGSAFLLAGRPVPLHLEIHRPVNGKDRRASAKVEWRPPGGVWSAIPADRLSASGSAPVLALGASLPADDASKGYARGSDTSRSWVEGMAEPTLQAADGLLAMMLREAGGLGAAGLPDKLAAKVRAVAAVAWRGEADPAALASLDTLVRSEPDPTVGARKALLRILASPRFLYPESAEGPRAIASRLALVLWDSVPDRELMAAADSGRLADRAGVEAEARRMAADPRARAKLRHVLHGWLDLPAEAEAERDPAAFPGFDTALAMDLRESLDRLVMGVVDAETSDFRRLLAPGAIPVNARLAAFYGVPAPKPGEWSPVLLDGGRVPLITHPFILAEHAYHRSTSPIHRGVYLSRRVLGVALRPPPMAIEFMDDRFDPSLSMREKVALLTAKPACMSCHETINPLGFSLEHYDAVGRRRTTDNGKPIDAAAVLRLPDGRDVPLASPEDVARLALESPDARRGFVRQVFHHATQQAPAAHGDDTLARLDARFARDHHIRNLMLEIAVTHALRQPPR